METFFEGRPSDSPYIEMVWHGRTGSHYTPTCPADANWNLLFQRYNGKVKISVEGPLSQAKYKELPEGVEWLVIKFRLGVFIPFLNVENLTDGDIFLPDATHQSFWLHSTTWPMQDYQNAETFVERLVRDETLITDPVVTAVLCDHPLDLSFRTVRRRFLRATGLTHHTIQQIQRAQFASTLLGQGVSILDAVYEAGYADQPHMTRSLKRFIDQTPAQIARVAVVE